MTHIGDAAAASKDWASAKILYAISDYRNLLSKWMIRKAAKLLYRQGVFVYQASDSGTYIVATSKTEAWKLCDEVKAHLYTTAPCPAVEKD